MLTMQEIFDKVTAHLLTQNEKAKFNDASQRCYYRVQKGDKVLKCAIGCLIDDPHYDVILESGSVIPMSNDVRDALETCGVGASDPEIRHFLWTLMRIHDNEKICDWAKELKYVATSRGLIFNPPTTATATQEE